MKKPIREKNKHITNIKNEKLVMIIFFKHGMIEYYFL